MTKDEFILYANNSTEAIELRNTLEEKLGVKVNHIFGASTLPIVIDNGIPISGLGKIRSYYSLKN